jgi:hypothetical protein
MTPLARDITSTTRVTAAIITTYIPNAVAHIGSSQGFLPHEVSAWCL